MVQKVRTILVDYDGTLHDSDAVFASKLNGLLGLSGRDLYRIYLVDIHRNIVHEHYPKRHDDMDFHWRLLFQYLGRPYNGEEATLLDARFREAAEAVVKSPKFFTDTFPFLDRLTESNYEVVLSTGQRSLEKAEALRRAGGKDYFSRVIGEEILGYLKNDPTYYREALRRLDTTAERTISIGDTILTDVYPAKVVGIKTIWVNRSGERPPTDHGRAPDYEVPNLISALDYLQIKPS
jgi:putative hydrolase of the HAD superfamily